MGVLAWLISGLTIQSKYKHFRCQVDTSEKWNHSYPSLIAKGRKYILEDLSSSIVVCQDPKKELFISIPKKSMVLNLETNSCMSECGNGMENERKYTEFRCNKQGQY